MPDRTDAYLDLATLPATAAVTGCALALAGAAEWLAVIERMRRTTLAPPRPRLRLIAGGKA